MLLPPLAFQGVQVEEVRGCGGTEGGERGGEVEGLVGEGDVLGGEGEGEGEGGGVGGVGCPGCVDEGGGEGGVEEGGEMGETWEICQSALSQRNPAQNGIGHGRFILHNLRQPAVIQPRRGWGRRRLGLCHGRRIPRLGLVVVVEARV